jgi:spoIIIJ-associated protein
MDNLIFTGKTIDEAVETGLLQLNVTIDQVNVETLEEPSSGLLKIFSSKEAKVQLTLLENHVKLAEDFLTDLLDAMNVPCEIDAVRDGHFLNVELSGDRMGILIGRRGQTLDAIQYLTSLAVNKQVTEHVKVMLDTENYREKREKTLIDLARKMEGKAIKYHKKIALEPMSPYERRIIHSTLQDSEQVVTHSEGKEPYRRVIIQVQD